MKITKGHLLAAAMLVGFVIAEALPSPQPGESIVLEQWSRVTQVIMPGMTGGPAAEHLAAHDTGAFPARWR